MNIAAREGPDIAQRLSAALHQQDRKAPSLSLAHWDRGRLARISSLVPIGRARRPRSLRGRRAQRQDRDVDGDERAREAGLVSPFSVMAALVAGIHVFLCWLRPARRGWPGQAPP